MEVSSSRLGRFISGNKAQHRRVEKSVESLELWSTDGTAVQAWIVVLAGWNLELILIILNICLVSQKAHQLFTTRTERVMLFEKIVVCGASVRLRFMAFPISLLHLLSFFQFWRWCTESLQTASSHLPLGLPTGRYFLRVPNRPSRRKIAERATAPYSLYVTSVCLVLQIFLAYIDPNILLRILLSKESRMLTAC
jgi:hypothetical protein